MRNQSDSKMSCCAKCRLLTAKPLCFEGHENLGAFCGSKCALEIWRSASTGMQLIGGRLLQQCDIVECTRPVVIRTPRKDNGEVLALCAWHQRFEADHKLQYDWDLFGGGSDGPVPNKGSFKGKEDGKDRYEWALRSGAREEEQKLLAQEKKQLEKRARPDDNVPPPQRVVEWVIPLHRTSANYYIYEQNKGVIVYVPVADAAQMGNPAIVHVTARANNQ